MRYGENSGAEELLFAHLPPWAPTEAAFKKNPNGLILVGADRPFLPVRGSENALTRFLPAP